MRPRKNQPQKQNQNEHRYTDKVFEFWQQIAATDDYTILDKRTTRSESWLKNQATKISYEDGQTQLVATLGLNQPNKSLDKFGAKRALYVLVEGLQSIAELAMVMGYLLVVKSAPDESPTEKPEEDPGENLEKERAQFKIYNLTSAQHKIIINNPSLLQMSFRLEISLGLNEAQMIVFDEGKVLEG